MKKIRPIKNTCYDWLIDNMPELIRKSAESFKDKFIGVFKTNTPKQVVCWRGKNLNKSKTQKNLIKT